MKTEYPLIAVISGSINDRSVIEPVLEQFRPFPLQLEYYVASAHRNPEQLHALVRTLETRGARVLIGVAGHAAHLPGVMASITHLPVYGVPLASSDLHGIDALYSVVMMPGGVPVAAFGIGAHGLKNAILMACRHLVPEYPALKEALDDARQKQTKNTFASTPAWANHP